MYEKLIRKERLNFTANSLEKNNRKYSRKERLKFMYEFFVKNDKNRKVLEFFGNYDNLRKYKYEDPDNKQI